MTRARPVAVALTTIALAVAACGPSATTLPPSPIGTIPPTASPSVGPTASSTSSSGVEVDLGLLEILPETVDGIAVLESPDVEEEARTDAMLAEIAASFAAGFAIEGEDYVVAIVVELQPGSLGDEGFRDWRDSFDEGVCGLAGGVAGHAETEMGGRTVYIGTCSGGVRTYHVWLEPQQVLVSAQSLGERRLGERLVETLRP